MSRVVPGLLGIFEPVTVVVMSGNMYIEAAEY